MSANLFTNRDGANYQAQAVLAYLSGRDGIEPSWSAEQRRYLADPKVSRWENCREQGYVVWMRGRKGKQVNIAFFEHRNSDNICAVMWEQETVNAPTIETMVTANVYSDKWDVSHTAKYGECAAMAEWIIDQLNAAWAE
jgi:hypothetical protein